MSVKRQILLGRSDFALIVGVARCYVHYGSFGHLRYARAMSTLN